MVSFSSNIPDYTGVSRSTLTSTFNQGLDQCGRTRGQRYPDTDCCFAHPSISDVSNLTLNLPPWSCLRIIIPSGIFAVTKPQTGSERRMDSAAAQKMESVSPARFVKL